jgi:Leucine-rich repeat (LRR) protein
MESLPDTLGELTALTHLSIETASLASLPESLGDLSSLKELTLNYCHCLQVSLIKLKI